MYQNIDPKVSHVGGRTVLVNLDKYNTKTLQGYPLANLLLHPETCIYSLGSHKVNLVTELKNVTVIYKLQNQMSSNKNTPK